MISRFFIDRPIFASVISIIIVLAGLMALRILPIAQYPDILPTTITVSTTYMGANAETVANTVAAPLEQQINGVENMLYMSSSSSNSGQLSITVTFAVGTDPAQAEIDVNNRVQAALAMLPDEVRQTGVTVNRKSGTILEVITLSSPEDSRDTLYMSNYALLNILDELKRIKGVGDASLFGSLNYSMRIWLHPDKLAHHQLTPKDVSAAISEQNAQFALGQLGQEPMNNTQAFTYSLTAQGRFSNVSEFENIIIKANPNGSSLRLKDVARIELGSQNYDFVSKLDGTPAVAMGIYLQTGANAIDTTDAVNQRMAELSKNFPTGVKYSVPFDTTTFVKVSIQEVIKTFIEAILLVTIVVFLFLQNIRATLIPLIAVPVSLIGTFAGMYILGFSINLLTLFGMILAIGIVVDDAIIVIENIERIMREEGLRSREAAIKAMEEVSGPVIAIVLVLCAVFLPVAFISGLAGTIYKQFAVTIIISVILSGLVALTLTPALCAHFLEYKHHDNYFFNQFNKGFTALTSKYMRGVKYFLNNSIIAILAFLSVIAVLVFMFVKLPKSLVPDEDQGYIVTAQMLMPGSAINRTVKVIDDFTAQVVKDPSVEHVISLAGFDLIGGSGLKSSAGAAFVKFKDWAYRTKPGEDSKSLAGKFMGIGTATSKDAIILAFNPPAITGMSTTGGFDAYLLYRGSESNYTEIMSDTANKFLEEAKKRPELTGLQSTFSGGVPMYKITLDRVKAKALNVGVTDVFNTMQATFGTAYINDFTLYGRTYKVLLQSDAEFREQPNNLKDVFVRSGSGKMISINSLVKIEPIVGLNNLDRFNIFPAARLMGSPGPGYSSGQALDAMEEVAKTLPEEFSLAWTGSAYQEKVSGNTGMIAFVFGIIMVFLILAALYERWTLPLAVVASVPFAVFGAVMLQSLRGLANDVYFQVGLVTLIGLSAKNAILIIEFAYLEYKKGVPAVEAALNAARLRFRPIIMTSLAFILGCVPLYFSSGAGSASRHSIGTGIIGGMLAATLIATFFIPLFFKLVSKFSKSNDIERNDKEPTYDQI